MNLYSIPEAGPITSDYRDSKAPDPFTAMIKVARVLDHREQDYGGLDASQWQELLMALLDEEQIERALSYLLYHDANPQAIPAYADELAEKSVEREYQRELVSNLGAASNFIDQLGGDSTGFRDVLARIIGESNE